MIQIDNDFLPVYQQQYPRDITPVVSVLVTTYNHENFIGECLNRILAQETNFPIEIRVIDDASSDNTPAILRDYAAKYPDIVKPTLLSANQRSKSLPVFSVIYRQAQGDFVAGCDGDDFWSDSKKLSKQIGFLRNNEAYSLSFHNAIGMTLDRKIIGATLLPPKLQKDHSCEELLNFCDWIYVGAMVFRNIPLLLPPEFDLVENRDRFLPILLSAHGAAKFQPEVGHLIYRQNPSGHWSGKTNFQRLIMHARTHLIMTAYLLRIGEVEVAKRFIGKVLASNLNHLMGVRGKNS